MDKSLLDDDKHALRRIAPFPCIPVPFDPNGPYALDKSLLDDKELAIWSSSCDSRLVAHQTGGWDSLYYEFGIRQPALLVKRGWAYIKLFAEAQGVALLEEAQRMVGEGKDALFDQHLALLRRHVQHQLEDHARAWDALQNPKTEVWSRKWVALRPKPAEIPVSKALERLLFEVQVEWEHLKNTLSPTEAILRYNRLLSLQTNQLEGFFFLHESISRLVRIGFFPLAVQLLERGSHYFEIPHYEFVQCDVPRICKDILKAIEIVGSQSENKMPINIASVKNIHFESIYHSRLMLMPKEDPPTLAAVLPGVVQYCSFRKVPEQMERLLALFNEYLRGMGPTPSPMDALRIAAWSHAWFAMIHPFGRNNSIGRGRRVGRLLSSIPMLKCGLPPINIMGSSTLNSAKEEYVNALVQGQRDNNFAPLVEVFLKGMLESFAYIRKNCLVVDPNDKYPQHSGINGKAKLRRIPRKLPRD